MVKPLDSLWTRWLWWWCLLFRKCQLQWQLCCTEAWAQSTSLRRFLLVARLDSPFPLLSICSPRLELFWDLINISLNQLLVSFVEKKTDRDFHRCLSAVRASQCQCWRRWALSYCHHKHHYRSHHYRIAITFSIIITITLTIIVCIILIIDIIITWVLNTLAPRWCGSTTRSVHLSWKTSLSL